MMVNVEAYHATGLHQKRAYTCLGTSCPQCIRHSDSFLLMNRCILSQEEMHICMKKKQLWWCEREVPKQVYDFFWCKPVMCTLSVFGVDSSIGGFIISTWSRGAVHPTILPWTWTLWPLTVWGTKTVGVSCWAGSMAPRGYNESTYTTADN